MAGNKRPSFLKRQKEQQRTARAAEKRESRRLRKQAKRDLALAPPVDEAESVDPALDERDAGEDTAEPE